MSDTNEELIPKLKVRPATQRDIFFLNWGPELVKNQFNLASELLKQQITICIALLSVSLIFDNILKGDDRWKFLILLSFLLGLIFSFIGLMPFDRQQVCLDSPDDIEAYQKDSLKHKKRCIKASGAMILLGLSLIIFKVGILTINT
ncbi:hypothetical protein EGI22_20235 [Lacihabitans sp. LS3-19]|uniref:hypothetical protein n=1 Tax=Lacihabitans sp. LS3-19 TaxID=2487335 RepID=UPI0020CE477F|nr:hypothetical protein [Lacihabitans sp. LS3-19]MCP9770240.1 hypothetical protein [Lacihabitans sp. LS3-19]